MEEPVIVLLPGERLLWSGRPWPIFLTGSEWRRLAAGLTLGAVCTTAGLLFPGSGILPLGVLVTPLLAAVAGLSAVVRLRTTRRAVYAVTDRRVVVADRVSGYIRTWTDLGALPPAVSSCGHDGLGTLSFTTAGGFVTVLGHSVPLRNQPPPVELFAVPEAERVRDLIVAEQARTEP